MLHQTFLFLGQLWQLFEVSQILEFLRYLVAHLLYTVELQWLEHRWLVHHGYSELFLESLGKKSHSCRH